MRKILSLLLILFLFSSCDKDGNLINEKEKLPPITNSGTNTVGCLIDGKVFLPHQSGINPSVNCFYQIEGGEQYFVMNFADLRNGKNEMVVLMLRKVEVKEGEVYKLNKTFTIAPELTGALGVYSSAESQLFYTNETVTGELKITHLDESKSIIAGTFWFDAVSDKGEKVQIREGRFDWNY
ncbi:DUF6252 family protein [Flavobacterium piscisymbiosum]|uniref:DUF6252 family protein n=1 Tax=Flavobacterium piscisymbiosum TaxID=2893753 RepID=A0ABS8MDL6_9FLAO|nr:DUF6252 family protein [Flavobacterium sp. F-30]MCC9063582.1 DUF6252 family protein [Flavobacterium sp. F-30]